MISPLIGTLMTNDQVESAQLEQRLQALASAIGARIRLARRRAGLSQTELGTVLGISLQQVSKYETAVNRVTSPMLIVIAEALGVTASSLLGLSESTEASVLKDMSTVENLQLLKAFGRLSPRHRGNVLSLVETIAEVPVQGSGEV